MIPYKTKSKKVPGSNLSEVARSVMFIFHSIEKRTKRKPYIRSAYFKKEKIFFDNFWEHLNQKSPRERFKRLKCFKPAIELIKNSRNKPISKPEVYYSKIILHRFYGLTADREEFYVQIKEDKKRKRKFFMSCFPPE